MKKTFSLLIALLFVISCGGGGGGGGGSSSPPPPPDNFGSIMTAAPEGAAGLVKEEKESTEEFWTEERILEAVKNPMKMEEPPDMKIEISPQEKNSRQIKESVPESFPPHDPDAEKKTKLLNEKINFKADQSKASEASSSCPQLSYQMYSGRGYQDYPEKTMGVLVFQKKGAGYYCSASLIDKRMILTAAHCVSSDAAWHTRFLFIPGYNNGSNREPYGRFPASHVLVYSGWFNNRYYPADYAIIVLRDAIGDQLGWLGLDVNVSPVGKIWDQWGYPGEPVGDGMTLLMNRSEYGGEDCSAGTPCRITIGSGFAPGASGGPWILRRDNNFYANSVTSQGITQCKVSYSPFFDTHAGDLYRAAQTMPAPAPTPTPTPTPTPSPEALIGNFTFVYKIVSTWTDRITLNAKSDQRSSEGTDIYTGYDADYPSVTFSAGSWSPSISRYMIVTLLDSSAYVSGYIFSINADNTLPGCYMLSNDDGDTWSDCYSFILPSSRKSPLGSWAMKMESHSDPIGINDIIKKKMAEDQKAQQQRTESAVPVDAAVTSKVKELKAIIEKNR
jgi:hypothetical protein